MMGLRATLRAKALGSLGKPMLHDRQTGKRGAVRIANSGLPVDHSGPGLGVGPTTPPTAGRKPEACPPTFLSPSQQKSGQGSGGEVPGGGEAAVPSSLDPIRSNRNRPTKRKPYCGCFTLAGQSLTGQETQYQRLNCKTWGCSHCGPRRAKRYRHGIRAVAEQLKLQRLVTLTLDPEKIQGADPVVHLRLTFNKLRTYLRRKCGSAPKYIAVLEFHENGKPHLHVLIDRFIEQAWLSAAWNAIGGGRIVDIRFVDLHRVSHYLAKYLTVDLLLSAPRGVRRVTCSRGIVLLESGAKSHKWSLIRTTIFHLYARLFLLIVQSQYDEDHILSGFVVSNLISRGEKT
jgi:hypothetical protein